MGCLRLTYTENETPLYVSREEKQVPLNWQVWVADNPVKETKECGVQQNGGTELSGSDIQNLSQQLGNSPSGQDVIDFISNVNSTYPNAFVTGSTLSKSVSGIVDKARASLSNIDRITKSGNNISVAGGTKINIFPGLNLKISDGATFNISSLTQNSAVIDVTGIKVGFASFHQVIVSPTSVAIKIGFITKSFDLK